jgi:exosortase/archaeosortase family protein
MYLPLGERFTLPPELPYTGDGGPELIALHITVECASYVAVIPLLLLSGFLVGATRVHWLRWMLGTLAGGIGIFLVNQLRLALIVFSTSTWGMHPGYDVSHILVGSIIGLCGFVACFFLTLRIMNPRGRRQQLPGGARGPA